MDELDKKILNELQFNFPIVEQPYAEIGERLGLTEMETIKRIAALKTDKVVRRLGPTFEGSKLGYVNTLVAMKVPDDKLDETGEFVSHFDEVTHNYARDDEFNLWFTLTAPNRKRIDDIFAEIKSKNNLQAIHDLPALKKFKINARFEL